MSIHPLFIFVCLIFLGKAAFSQHAQEVDIQAYLSLADVEAGIKFSCPAQHAREFSVGEISVRISIGQRSALLRIRDRRHDFVFFNQRDSISVDLRPESERLLIYDKSSPLYILNGMNEPVGYLDMVLTTN